MIKTLFLHEISRCLFLYRVNLFRISVTGMPFSFFITFCIRCGMEWAACRPTGDPFCAGNPQTIFVSLGSWKKKYFGQSSKKDNPPGPLISTSRLLYFFTNLRRNGRYLADHADCFNFFFFLPSQGRILNIRFSWSFLDLAR